MDILDGFNDFDMILFECIGVFLCFQGMCRVFNDFSEVFNDFHHCLTSLVIFKAAVCECVFSLTAVQGNMSYPLKT